MAVEAGLIRLCVRDGLHKVTRDCIDLYCTFCGKIDELNSLVIIVDIPSSSHQIRIRNNFHNRKVGLVVDYAPVGDKLNDIAAVPVNRI